MFQITCPFCGNRDHSEFQYGGDAARTCPGQNDTDMDTWSDYVFMRDNPVGPHTEYWQHVRGCRSWLVVSRHTASHEITNVTLAHNNKTSTETVPGQHKETGK